MSCTTYTHLRGISLDIESKTTDGKRKGCSLWTSPDGYQHLELDRNATGMSQLLWWP